MLVLKARLLLLNSANDIIGVVRNDKGDCLCRAWEVKEKKLIEFEDNIFNMTYRGIGLLSLDVQGLKI